LSGTVVYSDIIGGITTTPKKLSECPVCGTKRSEIHKTSLVGCPLCYVVFEETVRPMAPPRN
jgi:protein-arginine kinase activator protein McsA